MNIPYRIHTVLQLLYAKKLFISTCILFLHKFYILDWEDLYTCSCYSSLHSYEGTELCWISGLWCFQQLLRDKPLHICIILYLSHLFLLFSCLCSFLKQCLILLELEINFSFIVVLFFSSKKSLYILTCSYDLNVPHSPF